MRQISVSLFQSDFENPFGNEVQTCAYFLIRPQGNLLFYSSSNIKRHFGFIREKGGIIKQYVNHRDEASRYCDLVFETFGAPLFCHELEKEAILRKCKVGGTFNERTLVEEDLEAIPTPGHCPGSTCYLWKTNGKKFLFTGDTFYPSNRIWEVYIREENQFQTIKSLKLLKTIDFDVLVPSLFIGDMSYQGVTHQEGRDLLDACIRCLEKKELH